MCRGRAKGLQYYSSRESKTRSATHPSAGLGVARHRSFSLDSRYTLDMVDNRESAYCILPFLDSPANFSGESQAARAAPTVILQTFDYVSAGRGVQRSIRQASIRFIYLHRQRCKFEWRCWCSLSDTNVYVVSVFVVINMLVYWW